MKAFLDRIGKWTGLVVVILAAILLEAILALQYKYSRDLMEKEIEKLTLTDLIASALRIDKELTCAEVLLNGQLWRAEDYLSDSKFLEQLLYNLVDDHNDNVIGAAIAFKPEYSPEKGSLYEIYARQWEDTIRIEQIGSPKHDYTKSDFYQSAILGDTTKWSSPYLDAEGAHSVVTTYSLPIFDKGGDPVGFLAVDLDTKWIGEVVNYRHTNPSSFTVVLSESGQFIAGPSDSIASPQLVEKIVTMFNDSTVERGLSNNGRITVFPFYDEEADQKGHVYYARKKSVPYWHMLVVSYDHETFGKLVSMRKRIMWFALLGLAVLGFIIHLFAVNIRRLHATRMNQERIHNELRIAKEIQRQMLPPESGIKRGDIDVSGLVEPAREVGGDLFDFFLRDEKLFFCIGDVSGKGVPAALVMSVVHSSFRSASTHENNPSRIMQTINDTSCQGNESCMFVTLFIGVLDLLTGRLHYCNAGHDVPMLITNDAVSMLPTESNVPIGIFDYYLYTSQEYIIQPMTTLFFYTDGLTEAKNIHRKQQGLPRVTKALEQYRHSIPSVLLEEMKNETFRFVEGAEPSDDLTMLAIRYTPQLDDLVLNESITLGNDVKHVPDLNTFVKSVTDYIGIVPSEARQIKLAVEEAVVNAINYAYPTGSEGKITVEARSNGQRLQFVITDSGIAFDPTEVTQTDITVPAEDRPIGGLGILLVRKVMDSVNYERVNGQNVLTLIKNYQTSEQTTIS
jgi:serine phosphatase RsbU (regulator of sigma subunit)/anti-sigma regulatory factor (Ser/Thr protein kinase)